MNLSSGRDFDIDKYSNRCDVLLWHQWKFPHTYIFDSRPPGHSSMTMVEARFLETMVWLWCNTRVFRRLTSMGISILG